MSLFEFARTMWPLLILLLGPLVGVALWIYWNQ